MTALASQLGAFVRRDWTVARSYRFPFLLGLVGSLVILAVMHEVGILVDRAHVASGPLSHGYFSYVLVGMAVLGIVHTAMQAFANRLREEQTTGTLEALLATPAPVAVVILGSSAYDLLQSLASGLLLLVVGVIGGGVSLVTSPGSLAAACLVLIGLLGVFAALGVALAAFTVVYKRGAALSALVTAALAVLGGVYFPTALLPTPIRVLADILPFTWGVDVLRRALLFGQVDIGRMLGVVAAAVVLLPAAVRLFSRSVDHARRDGSLSQY
jgi:ABC-2 type transport system permease protein